MILIRFLRTLGNIWNVSTFYEVIKMRRIFALKASLDYTLSRVG